MLLQMSLHVYFGEIVTADGSSSNLTGVIKFWQLLLFTNIFMLSVLSLGLRHVLHSSVNNLDNICSHIIC